MRKTTATALAILAAPLAAQTQPSVQQAFDAATAKQTAKDYAGALADWDALAPRVAGNPRTRAIVSLRRGKALAGLGRRDEAVVATRAGLDELPTTDATLQEDRFDALELIGDAAARSIDYASAADAYRQAEAIAPTPSDHFLILRDLVGVEIFSDPAAATRDMARLDQLLVGTTSDVGVKASQQHLAALLKLNTGDFAGAQQAGMKEVTLLGGLSTKTDLNDVQARSDYAIAAILGGKPDAAREYMAMTGAGRLPKGSFDPGVAMRPPECGGEDGLKPEDVAVIEFGVRDDGTMDYVTPIYAKGGPRVAQAFARAALDWSWNPEQVKDLPPFFRYRTRVEVRCSTAFERPSVGTYLDAALASWLQEKGIDAGAFEGEDAVPVTRDRAAIDAAAAGAGDPALVPPLVRLAIALPREQALPFAQRALTIVKAAGAPPLAQLAVQRLVWSNSDADRLTSSRYQTRLEQGLVAEPYASDPRAGAALRLLLADAYRAKKPDRARAVLAPVTADTRLDASDALRAGALIRLASIEQAAGNAVAARAAFERSGLGTDQCALLDAQPQLVRRSVGSSDFPTEALRWGFEGWTQLQYDISAHGRVVNERPVVSYPPFIFSDATTTMFKRFRYTGSFRPDGAAGCGGMTQRAKFLLPDDLKG